MVIVFLADGFEEIEALSTVDILRRCDIEVKTVSITERKTVMGTHAIGVVADMTIHEIAEMCPEAVVLPGGLPGSDYLQESPEVSQLLCRQNESGRLIAAICAAPKVLGAAGILRDKTATSYPGFEKELLGAQYSEERVVKDANIITSRGAGTAHDFAFAIAEQLGAVEQAQKVRKAMLYDIK